MISAGLHLMLLGMGIVSLFLLILVVFMALMGRIVRWIEPVHVPAAEAGESARVAAVLAAAAAHHHRKRGSQ
mgnify:CR=1 FL=1